MLYKGEQAGDGFKADDVVAEQLILEIGLFADLGLALGDGGLARLMRALGRVKLVIQDRGGGPVRVSATDGKLRR